MVVRPKKWCVALIAPILLVTTAGCGGSAKPSASARTVIHAGSIDVQLPPGWKLTKNGPVRTAAAASAPGSATASPSASGDTIPLAQENPQTKLFSSLNVFQSCLKGLGVKFIGAPDQKNPNSPTNNPDYLKNLSTCAARSNIVQALKDTQSAQDNLTSAQIELQNKGYLKWRDCMVGRGWNIAKPVPDAKGRLFAFGANSASSIKPPPGQDILNSDDVRQCATQATNAVTTTTGG